MLLVAVPPSPVVPVIPLVVKVTASFVASSERAVKLILGGSASSDMTMARWILVLAVVVLALSLAGASILVVTWRASRRSRGRPVGPRGFSE